MEDAGPLNWGLQQQAPAGARPPGSRQGASDADSDEGAGEAASRAAWDATARKADAIRLASCGTVDIPPPPGGMPAETLTILVASVG